MAHAENRPASRAVGRRRAAALGCLLLAGSLALTGCSSQDSTPDAKAPASRAGSTGRPTSAPSAAATASSPIPRRSACRAWAVMDALKASSL